MPLTSKYSATIIGSIITAICFGSFSIPLQAMQPIGFSLEGMFNELFANSSSAVIFTSVVISLLILFSLVGFWFLKQVRKDWNANRDFNYLRLIFFFALQLLIVHPLVYFIWATIHSEYSGDGQFGLGMLKTIPTSSIVFVILGLLIDTIKNKKRPANL